MPIIPPRLLQPAVRNLANCDLLQGRLWKYVVLVRRHYAKSEPPLELETTIEGDIRIRTSLSDHIEAQLFWQGYQEADQGVLEMIRKKLPSDGVFIDIGANIGSFTLVAAKIAQHGQVHAFEPSAHHFSRLSKNVAMNDFGNVSLNRKGLSDQRGSATLFLPSMKGEMNNSGAASLFSCSSEEINQVREDIELVRLDDYVSEKGIERIDLVKIDIEGAEFDALKGSWSVLSRFRPIVLMELDLDNLKRAGCAPEEILSFWEKLNYQVFRIENSGESIPIRNIGDLKLHQNLICRPMD
ncbi:MAG: FkbM family methyltransferase [Burkholderiales bacterium]|nr:FkbM family methyltransferase [Burkholderiales bacterium]